MACDLMVFGERNSSAPIWGNDRWVASSGRMRSSAAVSDEAPPGARSALLGQPRPERPGLADQGAQSGPVLEHLIDLADQRPGRCDVTEGQVDAGELDPGLNGQVGLRIGQQRTRPLSCDELVPGRCGIAPVHGHAGLHRACEGIVDPARRKTACA
jgi:hypothetical protein